MSNCFDVAKYILQENGPMTAMKLQKLLYYAQAWSTVWDEAALFDEPIEAWINGPVVPSLYKAHKGKFVIKAEEVEGSGDNLTVEQKETIDAVLKFYGDKNTQCLIDLINLEEPFIKARQGLKPNIRGNSVISLESMSAYYSSLV